MVSSALAKAASPQNPSKRRIGFLWPYLLRYRSPILWGWAFVLISTALDQVAPWMVKKVIDGLGKGEGLRAAIPPVLGILAATGVSGILLYFQRLWVIQASRNIEYDMRRDLMDSLLRQPKRFFDAHSVGDLMSRATNDLDRVRDLVGPALLHLARMGCVLIYTIIAVILLHWKLGLVGLLPALFIPFIANRFLRKMYGLYGGIQKNLGSLNTFVQDTVTGVQVVKGFGRERAFETRFEKASTDLYAASMKVAWFNSAIWPGISAFGAVGLVLTCWYGGRMVIQNEITIGTLSAAIIYLLRLQFPLIGLGWVASMIQRANASLDRLGALWEATRGKGEEEETSSSSTSLTPTPPRAFQSLELEDLYFSYDPVHPVLQGLTMKLTRGKSLGIVGPTGSGKTTLLHLICGLYLPDGGRLLLNGNLRAHMKASDWRRTFAYAPQDGFLFSRSIRENIEFGQSPHSHMSAEQAAAWAGLDKDIEQFPQGYDSLLGERGINLSGGQRQRVGLARAFLAEAEVLCLDDTLSALDAETETQVIRNLKDHLRDTALIVVSHRYSAVRDCDEILYLEMGKVIERGTHEELVALEGHYATIWKRQLLADALSNS